MQADPIPAVREDAASGITASIFADLRATLNVPFVNLIWRHLATVPGMLEWTWTLVKPLQNSGELQRLADALPASVVTPSGIRQPACVYDAVGVTEADRDVIGTMLRDYNAANAANLLSLLVAHAVLTGQSAERGAIAAISPSRPRRARPALPRLLGLDELSPSARALVLKLDQFGRFAATDAIASLYRHLAHWPGFLAVAHAALSGPHSDGRLCREHARVRDRARDAAFLRLLPLVAVPPLPDHADVAGAQVSIQVFTEQMIARMVVMGELMLAMLPE